MRKVIHASVDPHRYKHQKFKSFMCKIIHAIADPHRCRHQKAEAACARSFPQVPTHTGTSIKKLRPCVRSLASMQLQFLDAGSWVGTLVYDLGHAASAF
jgi:hypothetical protein